MCRTFGRNKKMRGTFVRMLFDIFLAKFRKRPSGTLAGKQQTTIQKSDVYRITTGNGCD